MNGDSNKPAPAFPVGTQVEVVRSQRHSTRHVGFVRSVVWHHKEAYWNYYIEEGARKISTRYLEKDLASLATVNDETA